MGVQRFEDLRVWQAAKQQSDRVGALLQQSAFQRDREISGQMNDAALSVQFNITEGFLRRKDGETAQFLRYAFASNGELKSAYYAATGRRYLTEANAAELIRLNESIARMIRRWQATLKPDDHRRDRREDESRPRGSDQRSRGTHERQRGASDASRIKDRERTKDHGRAEDHGRTRDEGRTRDQEPRPKD